AGARRIRLPQGEAVGRGRAGGGRLSPRAGRRGTGSQSGAFPTQGGSSATREVRDATAAGRDGGWAVAGPGSARDDVVRQLPLPAPGRGELGRDRWRGCPLLDLLRAGPGVLSDPARRRGLDGGYRTRLALRPDLRPADRDPVFLRLVLLAPVPRPRPRLQRH